MISLQSGGVDELIARNLARKAREQARVLGDDGREVLTADALLPTREELIAAVENRGAVLSASV